jgi:ATP-dependent Clp protease adaptor protein ClpS
MSRSPLSRTNLPGARPTPEQGAGTESRALRPYKVILHNDDVNTMDHVVRALLRAVPKLSAAEATRIMLEAHHTGRAVVIVCPKEPAELYRDRLESFGLTATIEPA